MAAKKPASSGGSSSSFTKKLFFLTLFGGILFFVWWGYLRTFDFGKLAGISDQKETVETFELAIKPDDLLKAHASLLSTKEHSFGQVTALYSPHLLLQVKYAKNGKETSSSSMLWDLVQGELVLGTDSFLKTRGFSDCLQSQASAEDFRILHMLVKAGGSLTKGSITQDSGMEEGVVSERIESLRKRHLVSLSGDIVHLHVESPLLKVDPATTMKRPFVHKETTRGSLLQSTYSEREVQNLVEAAFGKDLAILSSNVIYVPLYELPVQNPDGSIRRTYWNAISGKEVTGCKLSLKMFP
jgi:hypothetical protein